MSLDWQGELARLNRLLDFTSDEHRREVLDDFLDAAKLATSYLTVEAVRFLAEVVWIIDDKIGILEAEELYRMSLDHSERVLGPEHDESLAALESLGHHLESIGKLHEAKDVYCILADRSASSVGEKSGVTISAYGAVGRVLERLHLFEEAEDYRRRCYDVGRDWPDDYNADVATYALELTKNLVHQGRGHEALELAREDFGKDSDIFVVTLVEEAGVLFDAGEFEKAREMLDNELSSIDESTCSVPDSSPSLKEVKLRWALGQLERGERPHAWLGT